MATYQLVAATGSFDPATGLTTFTNRPANAVGLATLDANSQVVPTPQAALSLPDASTPRDPYDVDTAKRKQVVDANSALVVEADRSYYGKEFGDDVYGPGQPAYYKCIPFAPAQTGGATVWKWARIDIL